jgi:hypothetical protein
MKLAIVFPRNSVHPGLPWQSSLSFLFRGARIPLASSATVILIAQRAEGS